jgi:aspartate/methionine/tyrosine aminotransferase
MVEAFDERRRFLLAGLEKIGLPAPTPRGAFYVFPEITSVFPSGDSPRFCQELLETEGLAIVPGAAFGLDGRVRLSYATSMEKIEAGLERLGRYITGLS